MREFATYAAVADLAFSLLLTQPRVQVLCMMLPVVSKQLLAGRLRGATMVSLGFLIVPLVLPAGSVGDVGLGELLLLILKEAFIGLVLGFFLAIPFWVIEAVGTVIDYQRGASMGA